ncbi:MAG: prenyltransferase/squalene oxidase repeat-containing protein [Candidatus Hodarchaeales archaeon]|jgi:hypothetical protein
MDEVNNFSITPHLNDLFVDLQDKVRTSSDCILSPTIFKALSWLVQRQDSLSGGFSQNPDSKATILPTSIIVFYFKHLNFLLGDPVVQNTLKYIEGLQNPDGGWPLQTTSLQSSVETTSLILSGLIRLEYPDDKPLLSSAANFVTDKIKKTIQDWEENESEVELQLYTLYLTIKSLKRHFSEEEKSIIAKMLYTLRYTDGGIRWSKRDRFSTVDATSIAILLAKELEIDSNEKWISEAIEFISNRQNSDGGFPIRYKGSEIDSTALALMAYIEIGFPTSSEQIKNALSFLLRNQNEDGGYGDRPGCNSDTDSTVFGVVALNFIINKLVPWTLVEEELQNLRKEIQKFEDEQKLIFDQAIQEKKIVIQKKNSKIKSMSREIKLHRSVTSALIFITTVVLIRIVGFLMD